MCRWFHFHRFHVTIKIKKSQIFACYNEISNMLNGKLQFSWMFTKKFMVFVEGFCLSLSLFLLIIRKGSVNLVRLRSRITNIQAAAKGFRIKYFNNIFFCYKTVSNVNFINLNKTFYMEINCTSNKSTQFFGFTGIKFELGEKTEQCHKGMMLA